MLRFQSGANQRKLGPETGQRRNTRQRQRRQQEEHRQERAAPIDAAQLLELDTAPLRCGPPLTRNRADLAMMTWTMKKIAPARARRSTIPTP